MKVEFLSNLLIILNFSLNIVFLFFNFSVCPLPILVIVLICGLAISARISISPKLFVPISKIKYSVFEFISIIVSGNPI